MVPCDSYLLVNETTVVFDGPIIVVRFAVLFKKDFTQSDVSFQDSCNLNVFCTSLWGRNEMNFGTITEKRRKNSQDVSLQLPFIF